MYWYKIKAHLFLQMVGPYANTIIMNINITFIILKILHILKLNSGVYSVRIVYRMSIQYYATRIYNTYLDKYTAYSTIYIHTIQYLDKYYLIGYASEWYSHTCKHISKYSTFEFLEKNLRIKFRQQRDE